jgi:hypothetical protein
LSPAAVLCGKLNYKAKGLCLAHAINYQPKSLVGGFSQLLLYVECGGWKHQVHAVNPALRSSVDVSRNDSRKGKYLGIKMRACYCLQSLLFARTYCRVAGLYHVHSGLVKLACKPELLFWRKVRARSLVAVSQRSVKH